MRFTAPAFTGGAAINSYRATASPGGATATASSSPIAVPGLSNGTAYLVHRDGDERGRDRLRIGGFERGDSGDAGTSDGHLGGAGRRPRDGVLHGAGGERRSDRVIHGHRVDGRPDRVRGVDHDRGIGSVEPDRRAGADERDALHVHGLGDERDRPRPAVGAVHSGDPLAGVNSHQIPKLTGAGAFGFEVALSSDANTALIGAPFDGGGTGAAWVYTRSGSTWTQGPKLTAEDEAGAALFGFSVALSADGNTALVGGPGDGDGAGAAWVFIRAGGTWFQQGGKLSGGGAAGGAAFGFSVALSGDGSAALVGGTDDNGGAGAAWVFTRSAGAWAQQGGKLAGSGQSGDASFGFSVALSADSSTALIAGPADNGFVGSAWVFTRSGGDWVQQGGKLTGGGESGQGFFGTSVALSANGDTTLIGGSDDNGSVGAAWVFTRAGAAWSQQGAKLTSLFAEQGSFGYDVALSADGNTALVGAPEGSSGFGKAWMFTRAGVIWTRRDNNLFGIGSSGPTFFGGSVALSGDGTMAAIGGQDDNGGAGAVWMFTGPPAAPTGLSALAGNAQATVTFTPPPGAGSSYTVTASPGGATAAGTTSPIVVTGLAPGTAYTFTAAATNAVGTGPPSAPSNAVTTFSAPAAPTVVSATGGDGGAVVAFTAPVSDGGTAISSYTVTASPGGRGGGGIGSPIAVSGLTNGVTYTFTVTATNAVGAGAESLPSNAVTPFGPERAHPDPPTETTRTDPPAFVPPTGPRVPPPGH